MDIGKVESPLFPLPASQTLPAGVLTLRSPGESQAKGLDMILQCLVCGKSYEHIRVGRARPVVTCSPECRQKRKTQQTEESHNRAAERGCPPDKHGTPTGYNIYKCRCTRCASWARGYRRELRNRKANNNG